MAISNYVNKKIVTVSEENTLTDAVKLMNEKNVGCLVVVKDKESDLTPTGILTDRDIVLNLYGESHSGKEINNLKVKDVLSESLITINHDQHMQEALDKMQDNKIRRLPVVDEDNKIIGLLTLDDCVIRFAEKLSCVASIIKSQIGNENQDNEDNKDNKDSEDSEDSEDNES